MYDLEMMREVGYCSGVENYSRWFDGRAPGTAPNTLFDYFPKDMLFIIDESHQTLPQLHACRRAISVARIRWWSSGSVCRRRGITVRCGSELEERINPVYLRLSDAGAV